jgi:hypothetical protein
MFCRQSLVFAILELTAIIEISFYRITYTDKRKSAWGLDAQTGAGTDAEINS